jgi:hypothetical protein
LQFGDCGLYCRWHFVFVSGDIDVFVILVMCYAEVVSNLYLDLSSLSVVMIVIVIVAIFSKSNFIYTALSDNSQYQLQLYTLLSFVNIIVCSLSLIIAKQVFILCFSNSLKRNGREEVALCIFSEVIV